MTELIKEILLWAGIGVGGVTLGSIVGAIAFVCLKGAFQRLIAKINIEKVVKETVDTTVSETVGRVKKVSFSHNIQPLVESELVKINERNDERLTKAIAKLYEKQDKQIKIMEKFYAYFDNSMVSDEVKKELKDAIDEAKEERVAVESTIVEETPEPDVKAIVEPVEAVKTHVKVER